MPKTYRPQSIAAVMQGIVDPRPAEYRGVRMRSQLEADFARWLDALAITWRYEPQIYGRRGSGYLPDFEIRRDDRRCFVEVKPTLAEVPRARRRMAVIWDTHPDALLVVACAEECRFFDALRGQEWRSFVDRWPHHVQRSVPS